MVFFPSVGLVCDDGSRNVRTDSVNWGSHSQVYTVDAARLANTDLAGCAPYFSELSEGLHGWEYCLSAALSLWRTGIYLRVWGGMERSGRYARLLAVMQYVGFVVWPVIQRSICWNGSLGNAGGT